MGSFKGIYCEESGGKFLKYFTFPKVKLKVGHIPHSKLNVQGQVGSFLPQGLWARINIERSKNVSEEKSCPIMAWFSPHKYIILWKSNIKHAV